jgi:hypothetical protein
VDKNLVGSSPSLTAAAAPLSPSSINFWSFVLRAVTKAISDIAKTPFKQINAKSIAISM